MAKWRSMAWRMARNGMASAYNQRRADRNKTWHQQYGGVKTRVPIKRISRRSSVMVIGGVATLVSSKAWQSVATAARSIKPSMA